MKLLLVVAIAIALSSLAVMAVQSVSAVPSDSYNPYAPGLAHAGVSIPTDPYLGAPGQHFSPTDPYRSNTFAPGILNQGIDVGHGPG
jgi:hypothetical protein